MPEDLQNSKQERPPDKGDLGGLGFWNNLKQKHNINKKYILFIGQLLYRKNALSEQFQFFYT